MKKDKKLKSKQQSVSDKSAIKTYGRLLKEVKPYIPGIVVALLGLVGVAITDGVLYKKLLPNLIDKGLVAANPDFLRMAPIYILTLFSLRGVTTFFSTYFMSYVGRSTVRDFRCKMLRHMMLLPVSFFQSRTSGELISKINYDAEQVAASLSSAISDTIRGIFIFISMLSVMFLISWKITLMVMVVAPVLWIYFKYISSKMRQHSTNVQTTMGDVTRVAGEVIQGYEVVKSYSGREYEMQRVYTATNNNRKQELKMALAIATSIPLMQIIGASAMALMVYLATMDGINLSAGEFTGMFGAMISLLRPIKQISAVNSILQRGIAAADSIFALLDEPPEKDTGKIAVKRAKGAISLDAVYFNYTERLGDKNLGNGSKNNSKKVREHVIKNLNIDIAPGKLVAVVGHSGSGKSTLASLLPRFHDITAGKILLDGINIKDYKIDDLRRQIALVSQDVVLFNDTITNNIAYGCAGAVTKEAVITAIKAAYVDEFTNKLPDGLDTIIGDQGVLLSGGQKQRIAIARAILKDAPILILDEATSALDTKSERYIQNALNKVMQNRTTLVIAHRLSTIENADEILVLEDGEVSEVGSHSELINKAGKYAKLHRMQFAE